MTKTSEPGYVSVNEYLDTLNEGLETFSERVVGEVSGLNFMKVGTIFSFR